MPPMHGDQHLTISAAMFGDEARRRGAPHSRHHLSLIHSTSMPAALRMIIQHRRLLGAVLTLLGSRGISRNMRTVLKRRAGDAM